MKKLNVNIKVRIAMTEKERETFSFKTSSSFFISQNSPEKKLKHIHLKLFIKSSHCPPFLQASNGQSSMLYSQCKPFYLDLI
jgi:hypothetical protein